MTISIPRALLDKIDELAAADDRSRSKWVVRELRRILEEKKAVSLKRQPEPEFPIGEAPTLKVAEEPPAPSGAASRKKPGKQGQIGFHNKKLRAGIIEPADTAIRSFVRLSRDVRTAQPV